MNPPPPEDRPLWVGTSWKMNKTLAESVAFVDELVADRLPPDVQVFVLPPHTALATVRERLPRDSSVLLGAQNAHWGPEGAATGEISMRMAADAGASLIEMGHSERRAAFGETDDTVAAKAAAALAHGLVPLICVGEPAEVREAGDAEAFVVAQVRAGLSKVSAEAIPEVLIAYEPVWAIGEHGRPARPEQTAPVMARITDLMTELSGGGRARGVLYGGSVHPDNATELLGDPNTDGLFIGRAAWTAAGFLDLIHRCATSRAVPASP